MPKRTNIVFDPKSNEYLYDILLTLPTHLRRELNPSELAQIRNSSEVKRFVNNTPIDKKLALFTKLGMDWALLFFNPNNYDIADLKKVYKQYSIEGAPFDNINEQIRQQSFVITSKEIALGLAMMASNCHGETYSINKRFFKVRSDTKQIANISKNADKNQNVEYMIAQSSMRHLSRIMFQALQMEAFFESVLALQPVDVLILTVLFDKPHNFFREDVIQKRLALTYKPLTVATRCRKLFEQGYLEKIPTTAKKPAFQIKAKGVLAMGEILNRLVNDAANEL